ncbi:DDE-domain-containing protein [Morchella conica CCBAS932]|uniref:DDE-domain-containing protein n=1 Tax=Morchella conica CCBAS932 TaxID=1392247 RepID=A0A3N4K7P0_9PEZI|nr:DDE-domain-containing protein [Morchella conica CCBAS932]
MDEKRFMMGMAAKVKVICRTGQKNPRLTHSGNRTWVTVIESVSAAGVPIPPIVVINQGSAHYMGWYAGISTAKGDVATFAYSPKGWTDSKLGMDLLVNNFEKYTAPVAKDRWRLLILDGHVSHMTWEFFDYCLSHKIVPFCLPPHSTHLLQPLDVGLFGPLQRHYSNTLDEAMESSDGDTEINKGTFLK